MSFGARARAALWLGTVAVSGTALAQVTPGPANPPTSTPSEEEILKAIQADQATNAQNNTALGSAPGPTTTAGSTPPAAVRVFQSLNPDLSFIADFAGAWFSEPLEMNGDHDPKNNGFNLQALELAVGAAVDPYFRFDSNIVFLSESSEIEEAYATTLGLPLGLQIRAGKFLTRFGRFNPTHPHTWTFSDQPLVEGRFFGPDGNRGVGVEVSELLTFLPWYAELLVSANDTRGEGNSFLPSGAPVTSLADIQYLANLNQFFPLTDDVSFSWGLSAATAHNGTGDGNRTEIYGTDVYLKYRPLEEGSVTIISLSSELLTRRFHTPTGTSVDSGAFAHLFWRFAMRWGAGFSAEYISASPADPFNLPGTQQRYKANVTFWPTEFSRLRLQYDVEPPGSNHADVAHAVFLAVEFAVGAHGAHKF